MMARWTLLLAAAVAASCGSGGGGQQGSFRLIQFLEQGQDGIPRNRFLTFLFSAPVADGQDFAERLKIQNTQGNPNSNFSLAIGRYEPVGDRVTFAPRLPNKEDRSDAGFRKDGEYTVFLKAGPDALVSTSGDPIANPQEMLFNTSEFFADPFIADPPRVGGLVARDMTQPASAVDVSRLDPRPGEQALLDNAAVIDAARVIEPGAGGAPQFATPWRFELVVSEPVDPSTVTTDNIELLEIYSDATTSGDAAPPAAPAGYHGTPVNFKVPVSVAVEQQVLEDGSYDVRIVVQPLGTLVDNTRYRLVFGGNILGIDFRQEFIGVNGLTGDGETVLSGTTPYPEPGGLGYTAEFIVRDRPAITSKRTLTYDPIADNVSAEVGQTTNDPARINTALYNPPSAPGTALGFLGAFGTGADGNLAVGSGTVTIDTGDIANPALGKPFTVTDLNPNDDYDANTLPGGPRTYDSKQHFELSLQSLTVSSGSVLRFVGVNPVLLRVQGISQISGTIDISGADGAKGGVSNVAGGKGGPAGGNGGSARTTNCNINLNSGCPSFGTFLSQCGTNWPWAVNGVGPGRGLAGASSFNAQTGSTPASGGGGGSHGTKGENGSDLLNVSQAAGTPGICVPETFAIKLSSVVGVRGMAGALYGDPEVFDITWGGSGGGAGGSAADYQAFGVGQAGGGGGGGGGSLTVYSAGSIIGTGGKIDASGGAGGAGVNRPWVSGPNIITNTGGGGGGAGGSICLISGDSIALTASVLDATGGAGGAAPTGTGCTYCNGGGSGGRGIVYLIDPDSLISGLLPNGAGTYPTFPGGYLTIAPFSAAGDRFGATRAVTELFAVAAANPAYLEFDPASDILANVNNATQQIFIYASSAKADVDNPLIPNQLSEIPEVLVARVHFDLGATQVDTSYDAMDQLNPTGPNRDSFVRMNALFDYGNLVEAALGPFAFMDRMDVNYSFNG